MNIRLDGMSIFVETKLEELFEAEKSGAKSNIVRIISHAEYRKLKDAAPTKIIIAHRQEGFLRAITNICATGELCSKVVAVISWTNGKHHHPTFNENTPDPFAHTQRLDEEESPIPNDPILLPRTLIQQLLGYRGTEPLDQTIILIPKTLVADLDWERGKTSIPEFISELLKYYVKHAGKGGLPFDEKFVCLTISRNLHHLLESIAHGRSMNMVIRELYEASQFAHYKEDGPLHD